MIVIDPGHGLGNRVPGVFDSGAVGVDGKREADLTLQYANCLQAKLDALGLGSVLTRKSNDEPCSLYSRIRLARQVAADLLVSIHFNADADPAISAPDGKVKGFKILRREALGNPLSVKGLAIAQAVALAIEHLIAPQGGQPISDRQDLAVISYQPSFLLEVGFIDDPDDTKLIFDEKWMDGLMAAVAAAIKSSL